MKKFEDYLEAVQKGKTLPQQKSKNKINDNREALGAADYGIKQTKKKTKVSGQGMGYDKATKGPMIPHAQQEPVNA